MGTATAARELTRGRFGSAGGNKKLGPQIMHYSELPVETCPGMSAWCAGELAMQTGRLEDATNCYAAHMAQRKDRPAIRALQEWNTKADLLPEIPKPRRDGSQRILRWYVAGDLASAKRIKQVAEWMTEARHVDAWLYTHSWTIPFMRELIEDLLMPIDNLNVFASVDSDTDIAPAGWRAAVIAGDPRYTKGLLACPEQTKAKPNCFECGFCWKPSTKRAQGGRVVTFTAH
jgi:hypothetical protein